MSKFGNIMVAILVMHGVANGAPDYKNALSKSIIFFEGQRSGSLPPNQRLTWRGDSALTDGSDQHIDLVGGYYDAGDNIKFGFPMAFTTTMLAWSVVEFGDSMGDELQNAKAAIRWATDYFFKATSALPEKMFVQAGDPNADHNCWERPEDMDTSRTVYSVDSLNPGSDVAAETAAAMAAASIVFQTSDPTYSQNLLHAATQIFEFADKYRGAYSDSLKPYVCPFYCDFSGYQDELLWGASWLHRASGNDYYLDYIHSNEKTLGADDNINEFGWDNKHAGLNVLVAKEYLMGNVMFLQSYKSHADSFICSLLPETPASASTVDYTPGGLIYKIGGSNMQHVSSISFLLLVYANYLSASSQSLPCGTISATPQRLRAIARRQMEYILGNNPLHLSYMVGYGDGDGDGDGDGKRFPQRIHHRASSLPSIAEHGEKIACKEGSYWYNTSNPNPNILVGAVVGGPDSNDQFADDRADFRQSEPTTYINAPLVGVLAFFTNY